MTDFPYKVQGELSDPDGAGVFGHNTATSGATKGVAGAVDSPEGYGLYTDDDAYVGGGLRTNDLVGIEVVETASELGAVIAEATGPREIYVTDDLTISPGDVQWTRTNQETTIHGVGRPVLTFDGATGAYSGGGIITFSENPETGITNRRIQFSNLRFEVPGGGSADPLFYFEKPSVGNPWNFRFHYCNFVPQGGGPAFDASAQAFFFEFDQCRFEGLDGAADAYVKLGGTHQQFHGCRFYDIPDGSFGYMPPDGVSGTAHVIAACKFGGNSTGNGIKNFNISGTNVRTELTVVGCSFEQLSDSGVGILSRGGMAVIQPYVNGVGDFLRMDYQPSPHWTRLFNTRVAGDGVTGNVVDAATKNVNEHYCYTDAYDSGQVGPSLIDDPDNVVVGYVREGIVTVSPDGSTKRVVGIDNDGNVTADSIGGSDASYDVSEPFDGTSWTNTFGDGWDYGLDSNTSITDVTGRDGNQLQATVPGGENRGLYTVHNHEMRTGTAPTELYHAFDVRFAPGFADDITDDGKLPGFAGRDGTDEGAGGNPASGTGWSARMGWDDPGDYSGSGIPLDWYIYHMDASGSYGEHDYWGTLLADGQWYRIEQYIDLGTPNTNDGVLRGWIDGSLEYERTDFRWRESGGNDAQWSWWDFYHGGSGTPDNDIHVQFEDLGIVRGGTP